MRPRYYCRRQLKQLISSGYRRTVMIASVKIGIVWRPPLTKRNFSPSYRHAIIVGQHSSPANIHRSIDWAMRLNIFDYQPSADAAIIDILSQLTLALRRNIYGTTRVNYQCDDATWCRIWYYFSGRRRQYHFDVSEYFVYSFLLLAKWYLFLS